jgi:succinoglycan biosynthesis protein ExoA
MLSTSIQLAISVVMPCLNEEKHIEACLNSVLAQMEPEGGFEVLIVDGRSEDKTREIIQRIAKDHPRLRLIDNPDRITPAAFNRGIRAAKGKLIAIMGAHNTYAEDYLVEAVKVSEETGAENVGGSMFCKGETPLQEAIAASHHSPFAVGGAKWHNTSYEGPSDTVFGGVYRREVFEEIGYFDEAFVRNQDDELNFRLTKSGGVIWHSPRIKSSYAPRDTLGKLFSQYFQYGYWKIAVIKKHNRPASLRHLVPALFVGSLFLLSTASAFSALLAPSWKGALFTLLSAELLLWLAAAILAALHTAKLFSWNHLPKLVPIFACYHFGYGLGSLKGLLDFVLLRRAGQATKLTR